MSTENEQMSAEEKKAIKKQVKKETRKFKRKAFGTLIIVILLVGIAAMLLLGKKLGLFGGGDGLGAIAATLQGAIGSVTEKAEETKDNAEEVVDKAQEEVENKETPDAEDTNEAGNTAATEEIGGELIKEVTINNTDIIYNGKTYTSCDDFVAVISGFEVNPEDNAFYVIDDNANKVTYDAVDSALEGLGFIPAYKDSATE